MYVYYIHCRLRCRTNIQPFKTQPASLYIHTDMLKHDLWRIRQIHKTTKTRGIGSSPFQHTASKNRQRPIWLSLFSWLWCFILRTITINSLPQITQHRHCIGSALDIVSSATNWNELVSDAITVQLQLNPTPELAIDGNSSAIVWRLSTNAIRLQYQKSLQLWVEEEIIIQLNLNNVCWET